MFTLYVVVCRITGKVFGPFDNEPDSIQWAKEEPMLQANSWYVTPIVKLFNPID